MANILKLGTRRSLLAWAQSSWVARELERLNPGLSVELVGIETRGDRVLDVSLRNVEGKEFFVAELDDALRSGQVDLTVHSMKDLSLDRPKEFCLAAIPRRENPRDVILFGPKAVEKLKRSEKPILKIGTSSPRRIENIPSFLVQALPKKDGVTATVDLVEIRGNVNTRLSRVQEKEDHPKYLDGVVLAFAGLIRLWADDAGRVELQKLLKGVKWIVLPLRECPTAPAQGALAVECRAKDLEVRSQLKKLHDSITESHVQRERALLAEWGGGCHQKFGATSIAVGDDGSQVPYLFYVRGKKPDETAVEDLQWQTPRAPEKSASFWDGKKWRALENVDPLSISGDLSGAAFVAHWRAASSPNIVEVLRNTRVWTSGVGSWFKLAEKGIWVEGCAENLGYEFLLPTLKEPVLQLPLPGEFAVLTHSEGAQGWKQQRVYASYRISELPGEEGVTEEMKSALRAAKYVFWSSGSQYDALKQWVGAEAIHACGLGKTAKHLRSLGLDPQVFPSVEEWRKWAKT